MARFDRVVLGAVMALAVVIGVLALTSVRLGPTIDSVSTARLLDGTSVDTQVGVTFTQPMNAASVERSFRIRPRVSGDFVWAGNQLIFSPRRPLAYDRKYTLTVGPGASDRSGKHLLHTFTSTFTTESHHLLYLGTDGAESKRLVLASIKGSRRIVGGGDGQVTDYSLSLDHSIAVYVKKGARSERPDEIWLLSLADNSTQRVFRRPDWTISQPHFSPDRRFVVFLATNVMLCQKYYGCYRDKTGPVIYILDLRNRKARPFHSTTDVPITNFIDFSPAGQLAYTDLGSALTLATPDGMRLLHVPNRGNSLEYAGFDPNGDKAAFVGQTPTSSGGEVLVYVGGKYDDVSKGVYDSSVPAFSTSGSEVAYSAYRGEREIQPLYGINVYDFRTRKTKALTNEHLWSDWAPHWSIDDQYIAFIRSRPQEAMYMGSGEIWVMRSDGSNPHPLGALGSNVRWVS